MGQPERVLSSTVSPRHHAPIGGGESARPGERPGRGSAQPLIEPPGNPTSVVHQPRPSGQCRRGKRQMEFAPFAFTRGWRQSLRVPTPAMHAVASLRLISFVRATGADERAAAPPRRNQRPCDLDDNAGVLVVNPQVGAPPGRRRMLFQPTPTKREQGAGCICSAARSPARQGRMKCFSGGRRFSPVSASQEMQPVPARTRTAGTPIRAPTIRPPFPRRPPPSRVLRRSLRRPCPRQAKQSTTQPKDLPCRVRPLRLTAVGTSAPPPMSCLEGGCRGQANVERPIPTHGMSISTRSVFVSTFSTHSNSALETCVTPRIDLRRWTTPRPRRPGQRSPD